MNLFDEKTNISVIIYSAFFDMMLPQKVRQVGLSETHACRCVLVTHL